MASVAAAVVVGEPPTDIVVVHATANTVPASAASAGIAPVAVAALPAAYDPESDPGALALSDLVPGIVPVAAPASAPPAASFLSPCSPSISHCV